MVKLPSAKVYSLSVSISFPGQSPICVKVTTLGPRTLLATCGKGSDEPAQVCILKSSIDGYGMSSITAFMLNSFASHDSNHNLEKGPFVYKFV